MKHESNEVKQLAAQIVTFVSRAAVDPLKPDFLKVMIPVLVMGTKEKNAAVKSCSEHALIAALKLRTDDSQLQVRCSFIIAAYYCHHIVPEPEAVMLFLSCLNLSFVNV